MDGERTAADVFRLLSDQTRLDVLRTVARAQHEGSGPGTLSFSDIYDRVDVANTSKLSYHLGELTGTFLRKQDGTYAFTHAGERLVRFVLAENYAAPDDVGPVPTDGTCLHCGEAALRATLEAQFFTVRCEACERPAFVYRVTPAQVRERGGEALVDAVIWAQAADFLKMRQGVCPDCAGRLDTSVLAAEDVPAPAPMPVSFGTLSECRACLRRMSVPLTHAAVYHPESVAFHWEHGVDIVGTGVWEFHRHLYDGQWAAERVEDEPEAYRVELRVDTTSLHLYLDEHATVTRTERVQRRDQRERRS